MMLPADVIPHRGAILLVDEITGSVPGKSVNALHRVRADEPCFARAPGPAGLTWPRVLVTEFLAQTAAVLCALTPDVVADDTSGVPLFAGAWNIGYTGDARIGDVVHAEARITGINGPSVFVSGTASVGDVPIARIDRALMMYATLE